MGMGFGRLKGLFLSYNGLNLFICCFVSSLAQMEDAVEKGKKLEESNVIFPFFFFFFSFSFYTMARCPKASDLASFSPCSLNRFN